MLFIEDHIKAMLPACRRAATLRRHDLRMSAAEVMR
jgi:hypothetical protein